MAEREYNSAQRQGSQVVASPSVASQGVGAVRVQQPTPSLLDNALAGLSRLGEQYGKQKFDMEVQQAHLDGERARATGQSMEQLQSNPLTAPFIRDGWLDQNYQLAQADFSAKAQEYIQGEGRTKTPEEFSQWVAENSKETNEAMSDNMSLESRVQAIKSQTGVEKQLIQAHTAAYAKYSQEQYADRVVTGGNAHITSYMNAVANNDAQGAQQAMSNLTEYAQGILNNPKLTDEVKHSATTNLLRAAVTETGNVTPVAALLREGKLDSLPSQQRMQLDALINKSQDEGVTQARIDFSDQWGQMTRKLQLNEPVSYDQFKGMLDKAKTLDMPASFYDSAYKTWYDSGMNSNVAIAAKAAMVGDTAALARTGKSISQGIDSIYQYAINQTNGDVFKSTMYALDAGMRYGVVPKAFNENVTTALRGALTNPDNQTPDQQKFLAGALEVMGRTQDQDPAKAATILKGFDGDTQATLAGTIQRMKNGVSGMDALKETVAAQSAFNKLDSAGKGAVLSNLTKNVGDVVKSEFSSPWYKGLFNRVVGNSSWDDNPMVQGTLSAAVSQETRRLAAMPQYAGALSGNPDGTKALVKAAAANISERSLNIGIDKYIGGVNHSLLVPPAGTSLNQIFNISGDIPLVKERLGALVAEQTKDHVPDGYSSAYALNPVTGKLTQTVYSKDGQQAAQYTLDPRAIGKQYSQQFQTSTDQERNGVKVPVTSDEGAKHMVLDGHGPGGMTTSAVIQFKQDILRSEGYRNGVYTDSRGVPTVGIGQNLDSLPADVRNKVKAEGKASDDQVSTWFNDATYKALSSARLLSQQYGLGDNEAAQAAIGKAVYQLGVTGWCKFNKAEQAIQNRDLPALESALKGSKWYKQTPKRVEDFLATIKPALTPNSVASN